MNPGTAPSLGRIVHYTVDTQAATKLNALGGKRYNVSEKIPGMIVRLHENNACNLTLFPDAGDTIHFSNVPYSAGNQPGTWTWTERSGEQQEAAA